MTPKIQLPEPKTQLNFSHKNCLKKRESKIHETPTSSNPDSPQNTWPQFVSTLKSTGTRQIGHCSSWPACLPRRCATPAACGRCSCPTPSRWRASCTRSAFAGCIARALPRVSSIRSPTSNAKQVASVISTSSPTPSTNVPCSGIVSILQRLPSDLSSLHGTSLKETLLECRQKKSLPKTRKHQETRSRRGHCPSSEGPGCKTPMRESTAEETQVLVEMQDTMERATISLRHAPTAPAHLLSSHSDSLTRPAFFPLFSSFSFVLLPFFLKSVHWKKKKEANQLITAKCHHHDPR